jgi:hypothetical protein
MFCSKVAAISSLRRHVKIGFALFPIKVSGGYSNTGNPSISEADSGNKHLRRNTAQLIEHFGMPKSTTSLC